MEAHVKDYPDAALRLVISMYESAAQDMRTARIHIVKKYGRMLSEEEFNEAYKRDAVPHKKGNKSNYNASYYLFKKMNEYYSARRFIFSDPYRMFIRSDPKAIVEQIEREPVGYRKHKVIYDKKD